MKTLVLSLLLLSSSALWADESFRVEVRVLERAPSDPAPTEFPAADATPLSSGLSIKAGERGRVDLGGLVKLKDVTSDLATDIPIGIALQVTPVLKGAQLTYRAQVTHSAPVFSTRIPAPTSAAEIVTRTYYQSGPCQSGEPVWFSYKNPTNGSTMFVALRLSKEPA